MAATDSGADSMATVASLLASMVQMYIEAPSERKVSVSKEEEEEEGGALAVTMPKKMTFTSGVCGGLLVGKSTLLRMCAEMARQLDEEKNKLVRMYVSPEPIEEYKPFLERFYAATASEMRSSGLVLEFQMFVCAHQEACRRAFERHEAALRRGGFEGVVWHLCERTSLDALAVFMANSVKAGMATKLQLQLLVAITANQWRPDHIVYLVADKKVCEARHDRRNRDSEREMQMAYVHTIADRYEQVFDEKHGLSKAIKDIFTGMPNRVFAETHAAFQWVDTVPISRIENNGNAEGDVPWELLVGTIKSFSSTIMDSIRSCAE